MGWNHQPDRMMPVVVGFHPKMENIRWGIPSKLAGFELGL